MLTTVEKVLALMSVELFARIAGEDLVGISNITEVEVFDADETIFEEGELGDSLYIILDGQVRVHKEDQEIARIGAGECFGEMSILDAAPRSASISCIDDVTCLRIDREDFSDLLSDRPEIALGVIRVLTRRLRAVLKSDSD